MAQELTYYTIYITLTHSEVSPGFILGIVLIVAQDLCLILALIVGLDLV